MRRGLIVAALLFMAAVLLYRGFMCPQLPPVPISMPAAYQAALQEAGITDETPYVTTVQRSADGAGWIVRIVGGTTERATEIRIRVQDNGAAERTETF